MIKHAWRVAVSKVREAVKRRTRSSLWRMVEKAQLHQYPACEACSGTKRLQVHHIKPFHLHPELELDASNLITLCMGKYECHLMVGHLGNWKLSNPYVEDTARHWRNHYERSTR